MKEKWLASVKPYFFGFLSLETGRAWAKLGVLSEEREAHRSSKLTPTVLKKNDVRDGKESQDLKVINKIE